MTTPNLFLKIKFSPNKIKKRVSSSSENTSSKMQGPNKIKNEFRHRVKTHQAKCKVHNMI